MKKMRCLNGNKPVAACVSAESNSLESELLGRKIDAFSQLLKDNVITPEEYLIIMSALCNGEKTDYSNVTFSSLVPIIEAVSAYFEIPVERLRSKKRDAEIVYPRHIAMYLMRHHAEATYDDIAAFMGGRDLSTVIHGANVIEEKRKTDTVLNKLINDLSRNI